MFAFATAESDYSKYNTRIGKEFLEKKAAEPGVIATGSGLLYRVITKGSGSTHPTKSDTVKVHYRGTLIGGKEFDSSYRRNSPASFGVTQVIRGWTEALQLMHVGDKFELFIPSELAYGTRGAGRDIGPSSTLIFEVELLEIVGGKDDL
jgi:FKBP-type peptidyl-prolyl cis-trans isomerase FklB